jgi:hypothetical protein
VRMCRDRASPGPPGPRRSGACKQVGQEVDDLSQGKDLTHLLEHLLS